MFGSPDTSKHESYPQGTGGGTDGANSELCPGAIKSRRDGGGEDQVD